MLFYKAVFIQIIKNRLGYFGTFLVRSAAEFVKGNVEPVVNILVDLVIIVAKLAWSFFCPAGLLFQSQFRIRQFRKHTSFRNRVNGKNVQKRQQKASG
jgi:hypothetical protein